MKVIAVSILFLAVVSLLAEGMPVNRGRGKGKLPEKLERLNKALERLNETNPAFVTIVAGPCADVCLKAMLPRRININRTAVRDCVMCVAQQVDSEAFGDFVMAATGLAEADCKENERRRGGRGKNQEEEDGSGDETEESISPSEEESESTSDESASESKRSASEESDESSESSNSEMSEESEESEESESATDSATTDSPATDSPATEEPAAVAQRQAEEETESDESEESVSASESSDSVEDESEESEESESSVSESGDSEESEESEDSVSATDPLTTDSPATEEPAVAKRQAEGGDSLAFFMALIGECSDRCRKLDECNQSPLSCVICLVGELSVNK